MGKPKAKATKRGGNCKGGKAQHAKPEKSGKQRKFYSSYISLEDELTQVGLRVKEVTGDGNCFFRALADQLAGDNGDHAAVRRDVVGFIQNNEDMFKPFVEDDEDFDAYVKRMKQDGSWAGHLELHAASLFLHANIHIYQQGQPCWKVTNFGADAEHQTLHLSYHDGQHYNSVRSADDSGTGPPAPIDLSTCSVSAGPRQGTFGDAEVRQVSENTYCLDLSRVRHALSISRGCVDDATEWLIQAMADDAASPDAAGQPATGDLPGPRASNAGDEGASTAESRGPQAGAAHDSALGKRQKAAARHRTSAAGARAGSQRTSRRRDSDAGHVHDHGPSPCPPSPPLSPSASADAMGQPHGMSSGTAPPPTAAAHHACADIVGSSSPPPAQIAPRNKDRIASDEPPSTARAPNNPIVSSDATTEDLHSEASAQTIAASFRCSKLACRGGQDRCATAVATGVVEARTDEPHNPCLGTGDLMTVRPSGCTCCARAADVGAVGGNVTPAGVCCCDSAVKAPACDALPKDSATCGGSAAPGSICKGAGLADAARPQALKESVALGEAVADARSANGIAQPSASCASHADCSQARRADLERAGDDARSVMADSCRQPPRMACTAADRAAASKSSLSEEPYSEPQCSEAARAMHGVASQQDGDEAADEACEGARGCSGGGAMRGDAHASDRSDGCESAAPEGPGHLNGSDEFEPAACEEVGSNGLQTSEGKARRRGAVGGGKGVSVRAGKQPKPGRNRPGVCGSNRKYKNCCGPAHAAALRRGDTTPGDTTAQAASHHGLVHLKTLEI